MAKTIRADGKTYVVPDDATDDEINQIVGPGPAAPATLPGMERLGGAPPSVAKPPVPYGLQSEEEQGNPFLTSPNGLIRGGVRQAVHGVEHMAEPGRTAKYSGAADVVRGVGKAVAPAAIGALGAGALAAPAATAGGLALGAGGSAIGSGVARTATRAMGASPELQDLAGEGGSIAGGAAGGLLGSKLPSVAQSLGKSIVKVVKTPGTPQILGGAGEVTAGLGTAAAGHPVIGLGVGLRGAADVAKGLAKRRAAAALTEDAAAATPAKPTLDPNSPGWTGAPANTVRRVPPPLPGTPQTPSVQVLGQSGTAGVPAEQLPAPPVPSTLSPEARISTPAAPSDVQPSALPVGAGSTNQLPVPATMMPPPNWTGGASAAAPGPVNAAAFEPPSGAPIGTAATNRLPEPVSPPATPPNWTGNAPGAPIGPIAQAPVGGGLPIAEGGTVQVPTPPVAAGPPTSTNSPAALNVPRGMSQPPPAFNPAGTLPAELASPAAAEATPPARPGRAYDFTGEAGDGSYPKHYEGHRTPEQAYAVDKRVIGYLNGQGIEPTDANIAAAREVVGSKVRPKDLAGVGNRVRQTMQVLKPEAIPTPTSPPPASPQLALEQPESAPAAAVQHNIPRVDTLNPDKAGSFAIGSTRLNPDGGIQELKDVPISQISAMSTRPDAIPEDIWNARGGKNTIYPDAVERYKANPPKVAPELIEPNPGQYEIWDGHHRIIAAGQRGEQSVPSWVPKRDTITPNATQAPVNATPIEQAGATGAGQQPAIPEARPTGSPVGYGSGTRVRIPGEPTSFEAKYAVRELGDVYPSHNPVNLEPNPEYQITNDRNYADPRNAERILKQVNEFDPEYLTSDSPTAADGAPVIDRNGNVLGGNSRAITLGRVYGSRPDAANAYRQSLLSKAEQFGLDPNQITSMKQPVLVREVSRHLGPEETQQAVTDMNKSGTAALTQAERALADSRRISPAAMDFLAGKIEQQGPEGTLSQALEGDNGRQIIQKLVDEGVIGTAEKNQYLNERGLVTEDGKGRISKLLVGRLFRDPAQLDRTAPALRNTLEKVTPALSRVGGSEWDLTPQVQDAMDLLEEARQHGIKNLEDLRAQRGMFGDTSQHSPEAFAIAKTLQQSPTKAVQAFRQYANDAEYAREGTLLGNAPTKAEAFSAAFTPQALPNGMMAPPQ